MNKAKVAAAAKPRKEHARRRPNRNGANVARGNGETRQSNRARRIQRNGSNGGAGRTAAKNPEVTRAVRRPRTELELAVQRYAELYEFAPLGYVTLDRSGRVEQINLAACELLGAQRQYIIGAPFSLYVVADDLNLLLGHLVRCRAGEHRVETNVHLKKRTGERISVLLSSSPMENLPHEGRRAFQTAIVDLSERERAEQAVRNSEERYRTLFDLVPVAVYACDAHGVIKEYNRHAADLWGWEPAGNGQQPLFCGSYKIYHPDGRPMPHEQCPMARALRGEKLDVRDLEIVVERPNGERRHVMPAPRVLTDSAGRITGAINCLYDITDRKQTEQALAAAVRQQSALYELARRQQNAKSLDEIYAAALDAIMAALHCNRASILLYDAAKVMRFVAWRGLSHRYRKAVEGHSPWKPDAKNPRPVCIEDVDLAELPKPLKSTIQRERIGAAAFIPLLSGGKLVGKFMAYHDAPHVFTEDELQLATTISRQLSQALQHHKADAALREKEAELERIVTETPFMLTRCTRDLRFRYVSRAYADMVGRRPDEIAGKPIAEVLGKRGLARLRRYIVRVLAGETVTYEMRLPLRNDRRPYLRGIYVPEENERGEVVGWIASLVDVTEQKLAEAALRRSKQLLERLVRQRTRALREANIELENEIRRRKGLEGEILAVSDREQQRLGQELHDGLCQQLTAIGFMARATALRLKNHRVIEVKDIDRIARLVNRSAASARDVARDLHKEKVDAATFDSALRDLVDRQLWKVPCRLALKTEIDIQDDKVAAELYRIIREALVNANKHARASQIVLEVRQERDELVCSVTDNGVGLNGKDHHGRGLGFQIMNYRAQSIGARLKVESPRNGGTRLAVYLPQHK